MGPPSQQRGLPGGPMGGMKGGQGPMPMPGGPPGGGGGPMPGSGPPGGGPMPMPGGGGGFDPSQIQWSDQARPYQGPNQDDVDRAMMDLQRAQIMGADPMILARLEQTAMQTQRSYGQRQQQQYGERMGEMSRRGPGPLGGGPGQSQLEQNPYLAMLLQNQLGMGGGRGGSPTGGLSSIGRG